MGMTAFDSVVDRGKDVKDTNRVRTTVFRPKTFQILSKELSLVITMIISVRPRTL